MKPNISIQNFLDYVFRKNSDDINPVLIDFYLETFEIFYVHNMYNCYMQELRKVFKFCVEHLLRKKCQYDNLRVHYTDIRGIETYNNSIWATLLSNSDLNASFFDRVRYKEKIMEIVTMFYSKYFGEYLLNEILKTPVLGKVKKEIEKSIFHINKYIQFINIIKNKNMYIGMLRKNKNTLDKQILLFIIIIVSSIIVDIYQIARIFKVFNDKKNPEPTNIITYSGESHAVSLRLILRHLGFKTDKRIKTYKKHVNNPKCLNVSKFLPFNFY